MYDIEKSQAPSVEMLGLMLSIRKLEETIRKLEEVIRRKLGKKSGPSSRNYFGMAPISAITA